VTLSAPLPAAALVVDDEPDHAMLICHLLADLAPELSVEVISTAADLATRLRQAPAGALVLCDRLLGGAEVLPVLRSVAGDRSDLTIALLSAWLNDDDHARAIEAGATHAAQKPATLGEWRTLLGSLLEGATSA
jgi:CheY-like chemotaxis protein